MQEALFGQLTSPWILVLVMLSLSLTRHVIGWLSFRKRFPAGGVLLDHTMCVVGRFDSPSSLIRELQAICSEAVWITTLPLEDEERRNGRGVVSSARRPDSVRFPLRPGTVTRIYEKGGGS